MALILRILYGLGPYLCYRFDGHQGVRLKKPRKSDPDVLGLFEQQSFEKVSYRLRQSLANDLHPTGVSIW